MPSSRPHVVILGGGPAGLGAAYQLRKTGVADVTLFEQEESVGGNAGSFTLDGVRVDYGSHRLHPSCDPDIMNDIRSMLGDDLRSFERMGRIRLRGRWVKFPLKPLDLLLRLDKRFAFGALRDMIVRALPGKRDEGETFASVLEANLGPTICEHFYFPFGRKMWGHEPEALSGIQARKRVSAGTFKKLIGRLAKPPGAGRFYYLRNGYGQISDAYAAEAEALGADMKLGWQVRSLRASDEGGWRVEAHRGGETQVVEADHVWSTIPVSIVARMMGDATPPEVLEAADSIAYRAMILVYVTLDVHQFSETDAHYFPEENVRFTRLSEPKNYFRDSLEPEGVTILCAEVPCTMDEPLWSMSDEELGEMVLKDMEAAGIPSPKAPRAVNTRRLRQAYPVYTMGYEHPFGVLDAWVEGVTGLLSYGRQGLFAHDNTHHALRMAYAAVDCLDSSGVFDHERWSQYRDEFRSHVVED